MSHNQVSIFEAVNQCSYNQNIKDYITNIILELCSNSKTAKYYKCSRALGNSGETIIVIRYMITTKFSNRIYEIPILIYIPSKFPYVPPEVYLERSSMNIGINEKNRDIDQKTNQIKTKEIHNWNSYSTLQNVIIEISTSFSNAFPIFQITNKSTRANNNTAITEQKQQNNQNSNNIYQQYNNQQMPSQVTNQINVNNVSNYSNVNITNQFGNITLNENTNQYELAIKSILIEDIKKLIYKPLSDEVKRLKREAEILKNYKNVFVNLIKKYNDYLLRRKDIMPNLDSLISHLDSEYSTLKMQNDCNINNKITQENCFSFVTLNNQNLINFISIEATIEDCLNIIKKSFERKIINFSECVKYIRTFSREMMKIKTVKEKMKRVI